MRKLICTLCLAGGLVLTAAPASQAAVVLNEVNCEGTDWVELVNTGPAAADVSEWLVTDDPLDSTRADHRWRFPAGTSIPAGGDVVVEKGDAGFPFGISCGGDTIRIADAADAPVDAIEVPSQAASANTWGRYPNGTGPWMQTTPTKGEPNQPSSTDPPPDAAAWLFDPGNVVEINLTAPPESVEALEQATMDDPGDYVDATFSLTTVGGTYGPIDVGIRLKGSYGSFRPLSAKSAFKLKFNHSVGSQRFLGLKKLTLNNMVQDPSNVHEVLSYEIFRNAGVAAPRTGYAYVRLNGQDYGLYLNVEALDEVALSRWFDSTRHLFEGGLGQDVDPGEAGLFEVDEGSETELGDLEALIDAVNTHDPFSEAVSEVADLEQMTQMWAVERYVGHWDGYSGDRVWPNNYYLHSDASGRFSMLPWGTDQTLVERSGFDGHAPGLMFARCLRDAPCRELYRLGVAKALATAQGLDLDGLAERTAATLAPWQALDPRREYSLGDIEAAVQATRSVLAARPEDATAWLESEAQGPDPPLDPAPSESPQTTITRVVLGPGGRRAKVHFSSNVTDASFECRDRASPYRPCTSPVSIRRARLAGFRVRAVHADGLVDLTPAKPRLRG